MSVLDLDFYKLTMLQFIWKHYAEIPVTFRLHSRKQDVKNIVDAADLRLRTMSIAMENRVTSAEMRYLDSLNIFEDAFLMSLASLVSGGLPHPDIKGDGTVEVSDRWFDATLWETIILSAVSEQYSRYHVKLPDQIKRFSDIYTIGRAGAKWVDFGTRRRYSASDHLVLIDYLAEYGDDHGFGGTSNVHLAHIHGLKPVGTYAHELEMVLRPYFNTEFETTRDVLTKWQEMYPRELRIALTDTYTTEKFLADHGNFLLENDWRGIRLDSGDPFEIGFEVVNFLGPVGAEWDTVFSNGLTADEIVRLERTFSMEQGLNPFYGWGTGLTNPNSDLSLVMKAVESNGQKTYKITDDNSKSIGN